ncbi:transcriptional regulatory protein [Oceanicola granulosus HTCC2516]|uniref:Transcriptional regulatory protein n=1 Tax=Oceanicola granulosus (strain ATCC BAA-861 / DSM 15982 / KCTC 12143 / HTCC2516) TaxID=314256 RepID=Q2CBA9_OCEGH|nr:LysR family transcriptional regulator [Oceanicola granulosus]EAR49989.1 transcriptional regulatory protein [Oceanicola granulosus HTCC2516]
MEMSQIRYALAAAGTLNFTKAASDCNVSQPALTRAIKALEDELGAQIFHREGRSVHVSEFGKSILPHLRQIMDQAGVTRTLAENYRLLNKAPVRLGVLSTVGHVRLARFLAAFEATYEGVELTVSEAPLAELQDLLEADEIDLAILNPAGAKADAYRLSPLYEERYVVILPPDHRLREKNAIGLADLSGESYVDRLACEMREMVMKVCAVEGVELYARFRSEREDWVQAMVSAGIGFAFAPEYSVFVPGVIQRPLVAPSVTRSIALASIPGRPYSPATQALVRSAAGFAWPG